MGVEIKCSVEGKYKVEVKRRVEVRVWARSPLEMDAEGNARAGMYGRILRMENYAPISPGG